jgi:pimeloyl-ACP methyl ester carboxylesterase
VVFIDAVALLAASGAAYQAIGHALDVRRSPESGRLVDIGGRRMQLYCIGQGSPTVILEAGIGGLLSSWRTVQPAVAAFARVCAYDRAGYGASDAGPMPRTSAAIAEDLHELLRRAGERPPYVLVGHSFGGYNVRVFNGLYPDEVAGIVLVDAPHEDQFRILPAAWNAAADALRRRYGAQARWAPLYIGLGIARAQLHLQHADAETFLILQSNYLRARASEMASMPVSAAQSRAAGGVAEKPLVVLTAGRSLDPASQIIWADDVQPRLVRLSARGRQIVIADSSHDMPSDRPDAIVEAVRELADPERRP